MAGIGLGIAWLGYWTLYYGVSQVQGQNFGFLDIGLPGKWATVSKNPPLPDSQTPQGNQGKSGGGLITTTNPVIGAVIGSPYSALVPGLSSPAAQKNPLTGYGPDLLSFGQAQTKNVQKVLAFLGLGARV